jgi:hypothetical protein
LRRKPVVHLDKKIIMYILISSRDATIIEKFGVIPSIDAMYLRWRNNRIRETLDQEPILNYTERSIQWYGHVVRMQNHRKPKQAMEARRARGRPRKTWEGCVIDAAKRKGKTFVELKRLARDRIGFSKWTKDKTLQGNSTDKEKEVSLSLS